MEKFDHAAHIEAIAAEALVRDAWRKKLHGDQYDASARSIPPPSELVPGRWTKVIFLDIDGVLLIGGHYDLARHGTGKWMGENRERYGERWAEYYADSWRVTASYIDKSCVQILMDVLDAVPDTVIVISSGWRTKRTLAELRDVVFVDWPFAPYILDALNDWGGRSETIQEWVERFQPEHWVSPDDMDLPEHTHPVLCENPDCLTPERGLEMVRWLRGEARATQ